MQYLILLLFFSLPYTAGATISAPISHVETAVNQQTIPQEFAPKKQRFFDRVAKHFLQKRIEKALRRSAGGAEKLLSILGFTCSALGAFLFFTSINAALVLLSAGLVLSILGLALSSWETRQWVKNMAIAGIVPPAAVLLLILWWLGSLDQND